MLEAHGECAIRILQPRRRPRGRVDEQHVAHEFEHAGIRSTPAAAGKRYGPVDVTPILRRDVLRHVSAIHWKRRRDARERLPQRRAGQVARPRIGTRNPEQAVGEHGELGNQRALHDLAPASVRGVIEIDGFLRRERTPGAIDARLGCAVDEQSIEQIRETIARRAMHQPVLGQLLVMRVDLFDYDVQRPRLGVLCRLVAARQ